MTKKNALRSATAWQEARGLMWDHRGKLAIGFALMVVNRLAGFILPGSSKLLVDRVLTLGETSLLAPLAIAVAAGTVVGGATTFLLSQVVSVTAQGAIMTMRERVQAHVTRLPVRFFDQHKTGELISRIMSDAEGVRNLIGTGIVQLLGGILTAVLALGALFWLNWKLTTATLALLLVFGGVMAAAFKRLRPIFRERGEINARVTGRLNETLNGIRVVKAYGIEAREQAVFSEGVAALFANVRSTITGISAVSAIATVVIGLAGILLIVIGGRSILAGEMTLGDLVMYIFLIGLLAAPVVEMASISTQISEALAGLDRIRELFAESTEDADPARSVRPEAFVGDIRFEGVDFAYQEGVPVLRSIDLHAVPGSTTALVGSSGSGKSTLVSLVMAFNQPQAGRILVDGIDLATLHLGHYRDHLGVVLQENFLFDGTVADNIRFARPDASMDEVVDAARQANCHAFVEGFPDGYDTVVGERGIKLSGGQRQRIAIARALLADPRILILDEATSNLDSESEALIQTALGRLRAGRTTFVIAHRLSTIRSADQILVLEEGRIVERGTHAELHALNGRYRSLHDQQYKLEQDLYINPGEDPAKVAAS
jgi:ABC-type multidrug transport system fused ATPase/permease subunit